MKAPFLFIALLLASSMLSQKVTQLSSAAEFDMKSAALWNQAIMQHDIIGTDFRGEQMIGTAAAERFEAFGFAAPDFWFPISPKKKTMGGELVKAYVYSFGDDFDHNLNIVPGYDFQPDFHHSIMVTNKRINNEDPLVDADFEGEDWIGKCDPDSFENFQIKEMQLEIDLHRSTASQYLVDNSSHSPRARTPQKPGEMVFAFGPWVSDAGHCYKPEIHPAEQIWWRRQVSSRQKYYYLLLTCDQSDRFDERSEFDEGEVFGESRELIKEWAPRPLKGTFAILFAIDPSRERTVINLTRIGGQAVTSTFNDGLKNYLVFKGDTVAVVNEPAGSDVLRVGFEQICNSLDHKSIFGFITLDAQVGQAQQGAFDTSEGGYLFLKAEVKTQIVKKLPKTFDKADKQRTN